MNKRPVIFIDRTYNEVNLQNEKVQELNWKLSIIREISKKSNNVFIKRKINLAH